MQKIEFPENFLWGTSTSAYQIEGGNKNDWSEWEVSPKRIAHLKKKNKNPENYVCGESCHSYFKYEEDFDLAKSLNTNAIRIGFEWSRIIPKKDLIDVKAIRHYKKVLDSAHARGLKTVVTLWHWTNPIWFTEEGGWVNKKSVDYFLHYVDLIIQELGGSVDYWVTLNEPMVHVANGYISGKFPPNKKLHLLKANKVLNNLAEAHQKSYEMIHKHFPKAEVSITALLNNFEQAHKWCFVEKIYTKIFHYLWNEQFLNKIKNHMDYIGLDYYFHDRIVFYPPFKKNKNKKTTDLDWEIYPQGIYNVLKFLKQYNKPIIIMENGLADKEDKYREQFIKDHLFFIYKAMQEGTNIKGYFHWSLLDNFEWAEGWNPKFGLFEVDRKTFERKARPSASVYTKICEEGGFDY